VSHCVPQALPEHTGCAWAMAAGQVLPQAPQLPGSLVVSAHVEPQRLGALAGHPEVQE
jgi:hypothetical protein